CIREKAIPTVLWSLIYRRRKDRIKNEATESPLSFGKGAFFRAKMDNHGKFFLYSKATKIVDIFCLIYTKLRKKGEKICKNELNYDITKLPS
ncbi:MAG: hypothetical protein IKL51_11260, partial [Lachnospiraceae bacterium]|nr:hypothetical protein [Lachnospiraceae bacterium]